MEDIILYKTQTHAVNLNNSGTMNQSNLDFAKRTMLFDAVREHVDIVKTKQGYPNNDISEVEMEIDCVVMSRKKYDKLIKLQSALDNQYKDSKKEILIFPKLEP
jgi:hypothetical protein